MSTGDRTAISADGLDMTITAVNVRDLVVAAAADYRTSQVGSATPRSASLPGPGSRRPPSCGRRRPRSRGSRRDWARTRTGSYGRPDGRRLRHGGPGRRWIPTGVGTANLAYLVTHEIAHQWFYGLVGSDQAREPFADEAPADFVTRDILGMRRSSRCARADLDRSIYRYSKACYYEVVYIQGGNLLAAARTKMGSTAFWAAIRRYLADNRWGLVHTRTLLDALDAATARDLAAWWGRRFPRLY